MRKDKARAFDLRKAGESYNKIAGLLKVPKSTLSEWFKNEKWSENIKKRLNKKNIEESTIRIVKLDAIRGKKLEEAYDRARQEAKEELALLRYHPLFIAGLMLYWGEGDKRTKGITRFVNTDPATIRIFVLFLKDICKIPEREIRASVLIYPDLDEEKCRQYWALESGLDIKNFRKSVTIIGRHKTRRLSNGVCNVYVVGTYFKVKMLDWLKLMGEELMSEEYYASI